MKSKMRKLVAIICILALGVSSVAINSRIKEVKAAEGTEVTPVYLEGFKHITLSSFNSALDLTGTQLPDTIELDGYNSSGEASSEHNCSYLTNMQQNIATSFDKSFLSVWVDFKMINQAGSRIEMAGSDSGTDTESGI